MTNFRLTPFDLTVFIAMSVLLALIAATAVVGISEPILRVAYLKLGDNTRFYDVWMANPAEPDSAEQITFTESGVFDYDISADGRYVAYSERSFDTGIADIKLLDLRTNDTRILTNCVMQDSDCTSPSFRPDGNVIAYERVEFNTTIGGGVGSNRIWLLDLTTEPPSTYPLFEDSQILGYSAEWSADGSKLMFYESVGGGILIFDFNADDAKGENPVSFIPSNFGEVGAISPDGEEVIFPEMMLDNSRTRSFLQLANLESGVFVPISEPDSTSDDQQPSWSPDGRFVALGRQYWDEDRYTRGHQIYLMDMDDETVTPLIYDPAYSNALPEWSPQSEWLAFQRFPQLDDNGEIVTDGTTEVWTYEIATQKLFRIDDNARNPLWVAPYE